LFVTFRRCKNEAGWKNRIGSNVAQRIAEQTFTATQQYAFGKRGRSRFKGVSAFLARCATGDMRHPSHIASMWAAQKPVLLQTGWLRYEPAKIEPSGKITVAIPLERVVCNRGLAVGHGRDAVVAGREPGDPDGFVLKTSRLSRG
jgi:hypothetical protein